MIHVSRGLRAALVPWAPVQMTGPFRSPSAVFDPVTLNS